MPDTLNPSAAPPVTRPGVPTAAWWPGSFVAPPLEDVRGVLAACIKCGACMPVCPTYREEHRESMGPRGRLALAMGLLQGDIAAAEGVALPISSCIDCRACVPVCPRHLPLDEVFYAAKAELAVRGGGGLRGIGVWLLRRATHFIVAGNRFGYFLGPGRLFGALYRGISDTSPVARLLPFFHGGRKRELPGVRSRPLTSSYPEVISPPPGVAVRGRVAFFPGCVINFTSTDIGHATLRALGRLGVEVVMPGDAPCCGIPLLSLGDREGARSVARDVMARYGNLQVDALLTACASCGTTLRDTYPVLFAGQPGMQQQARQFASRVLDVTEYVLGHTDFADRAARLDMAVTYHDPCHLVRGMGVTEEPRQILRTVTSGFVEMREADRCCGFGGLFSALHYGLSLEVGARKVQAVAASGAPVVATGCPGCQMHMNDTLARGGVSATVLHTIEVLDRALEAGTARQDVSCGK